jgi:hypothetical protein
MRRPPAVFSPGILGTRKRASKIAALSAFPGLPDSANHTYGVKMRFDEVTIR